MLDLEAVALEQHADAPRWSGPCRGSRPRRRSRRCTSSRVRPPGNRHSSSLRKSSAQCCRAGPDHPADPPPRGDGAADSRPGARTRAPPSAREEGLVVLAGVDPEGGARGATRTRIRQPSSSGAELLEPLGPLAGARRQRGEGQQPLAPPGVEAQVVQDLGARPAPRSGASRRKSRAKPSAPTIALTALGSARASASRRRGGRGWRGPCPRRRRPRRGGRGRPGRRGARRPGGSRRRRRRRPPRPRRSGRCPRGGRGACRSTSPPKERTAASTRSSSVRTTTRGAPGRLEGALVRRAGRGTSPTGRAAPCPGSRVLPRRAGIRIA